MRDRLIWKPSASSASDRDDECPIRLAAAISTKRGFSSMAVAFSIFVQTGMCSNSLSSKFVIKFLSSQINKSHDNRIVMLASRQYVNEKSAPQIRVYNISGRARV
jgi:hypothetical protein